MLLVNAQEAEVAFSYIHLKQGDLYIGKVISQNDTAIVVDEINIGRITLIRKKVLKVDDVLSGTRVAITMLNNTQYTGYIMKMEGSSCIVKPETGSDFKVDVGQISEIKRAPSERIFASNPNATRYFFAPSAITLEKGAGYYQNAYLLSNSVNFGLTDRFTLGGGVIIPLLFYITPKISVKVSKNLYLAGGCIAGTTIIPDAIISGGIPFGLVTYGNEENNVTVGVGYGLLWNEGKFNQTNYPITTLNGMVRISNRIQLVSENWVIPFMRTVEHPIGEPYYDLNGNLVEPEYWEEQKLGWNLVASAGMRIIVGKRSSVDFSPLLITGYGITDALVIPYLDYVYKF